MQKTPLNVQQWIDTLPASNQNSNPCPEYNFVNKTPKKFIPREISIQSDNGSTCSSVESVLELRKPDPEEVLLELGFGPSKNSSVISKIPARFLQPSKLISQINIEKFLEQYGVNKHSTHSTSLPATSRPKSC